MRWKITEQNCVRKNWRLIIAEEFEKFCCDGLICPADEHSMRDDYPPNSIVYLWNNTLQIVVPVSDENGNYKYKFTYEIDLDRSDELDWLEHVASKKWSSPDLIMNLASSARRIGNMRNITDKKFWDCWSEERALDAAEIASENE